MPRLLVSEKTLELNICAWVLSTLRGQPGCERAFWIGLKQRQEQRYGLDELVSALPPGRHLGLQFKAPRRLPPNSEPYRYPINARQNEALLRLSAMGSDSVFYVL